MRGRRVLNASSRNWTDFPLPRLFVFRIGTRFGGTAGDEDGGGLEGMKYKEVPRAARGAEEIVPTSTSKCRWYASAVQWGVSACPGTYQHVNLLTY